MKDHPINHFFSVIISLYNIKFLEPIRSQPIGQVYIILLRLFYAAIKGTQTIKDIKQKWENSSLDKSSEEKLNTLKQHENSLSLLPHNLEEFIDNYRLEDSYDLYKQAENVSLEIENCFKFFQDYF